MTRNNLSEHLSWLLNDQARFKPATPTFPSCSDASQTGLSQSQRSDSQGRQTLQSGPPAQPGDGTNTNYDASTSSNGRGGPGGLRNTDQVILEDDTMARLMSSSKPKKPSLVSRPQQLLTPSSITPNRLSRQDTPVGQTNNGKYTRLLICQI
ncbi:ATP-dependent DNA helicase sgs1 [Fusarium solani]